MNEACFIGVCRELFRATQAFRYVSNSLSMSCTPGDPVASSSYSIACTYELSSSGSSATVATIVVHTYVLSPWLYSLMAIAWAPLFRVSMYSKDSK